MRLVQELSRMIELFEALALPNPWLRTEWENILPRYAETGLPQQTQTIELVSANLFY